MPRGVVRIASNGVIKGFFGFDVFKEQPNFWLENFYDICWGLNFGLGFLGGFVGFCPHAFDCPHHLKSGLLPWVVMTSKKLLQSLFKTETFLWLL